MENPLPQENQRLLEQKELLMNCWSTPWLLAGQCRMSCWFCSLLELQVPTMSSHLELCPGDTLGLAQLNLPK